jgi:hypothetical protein
MEAIKDPKYFSLKKVKQLTKEVEKDPAIVKELVKLTLGDDLILSMRASWALQHISFQYPKLIYPQIPSLLKFLRKEKQHTGAIRNVIRIFHEVEVPEKYCGELFDLCLKYTKNAALPPAVRAFSIVMLADICKKYPELKHEVELVFSELQTFPQPPSITVCIRKASRILEKL